MIGVFCVLLFFGIFVLPKLIQSHTATPEQQVDHVKINMKTLQSMVEIYSHHWNQKYPQNVDELSKDAHDRQYWKGMTNPLRGGTLKGYSYTDDADLIIMPGVVTYTLEIRSQHYFIYGYDAQGSRMIEGNKTVVLSNQ